MISSLIFFIAAKWFFSLKVIAPIFELQARRVTKKNLLKALQNLKEKSFSEIAFQLVLITSRAFDFFTGQQKIFSVKYILRFSMIGAILGFVFSILALFLIANDLQQALRLFQKKYWWEFVVFPGVLTGTIFCPLDVGLAHMTFKWACHKSMHRPLVALTIISFLAYVLWIVSAGVFAYIGLALKAEIFMPSFLLNRITTAFIDPFGASSGMFSLGATRISFSFLTASVALFSISAIFIFFIICILKYFPNFLHSLIAKILFFALNTLNKVEEKRVSYPITLIAWVGAIIILVVAAALHLQGF